MNLLPSPPTTINQLDEVTTKIWEEYKVSLRLALNHLANRGRIPQLLHSKDEWRPLLMPIAEPGSCFVFNPPPASQLLEASD